MNILRNWIKNLFDLCDSGTSNRIKELDFLRGCGCLLILLQHADAPFGHYILAFHMPLFFILSGYTFELKEHNSENFLMLVKKKAARLLIPYLGFEVINLLLELVIEVSRNNLVPLSKALLSIFLCINIEGYDSILQRLWFLPCMFICEILLWLVVKYWKKGYWTYLYPWIFWGISYLICKCIDNRLPFTLDISIMGTGFILFGYYYTPLIEKLLETIKRRSVTKGLFYLYVGGVFFYFVSNNEPFLMYINEYGNHPSAVICAVLGSYLFMHICIVEVFKRMNTCKGLAVYFLWLGRNSLLFFPMHLFILRSAQKVGRVLGVNMWFVNTIFVLIVCVPIINFIRIKLPFLAGERRMKT